MARRKVIYAWNYLEWGGAQTYYFPVMKEALKHFDVSVLLPEGSDPQLLEYLEQIGVAIEFMRVPSDQKPAPGLVRKLERHTTKISSEIDLIRNLTRMGLDNAIAHVDMGPWQSFAALAWLSLRTRVFITNHNSLPPSPLLRRLLWKLKLKLISRFRDFHVLASNKECRDYFRDYYTRNFADRIEIAYTGISPEEIKTVLGMPLEREELCGKFDIPSDDFLIFCVGQFIDRKGRWTFLEAAREFHKANPATTFVWISNSMPSDADIERAAGYGLGDSFRIITGAEIGKGHEDLLHFMRLADVFALVSLQEGLSNSLLEAMAIGLPSIASSVNALPEAVIDGRTGLLVEPGDARDLLSAFERLYNDVELRGSLSRAGSEHVIGNFDQRETARITIESYKRAFGI